MQLREKHMKARRGGRTWTELPPRDKPVPKLPTGIRQIGTSISSLQYTEPFVFWMINNFINE